MSGDAITRLSHQLSRLPGIGSRSAMRLALRLAQDRDLSRALIDALSEVAESVGRCSVCQDLSVSDPCSRCADPQRDGAVICVVERAQDLQAIERSGGFRGQYHVLGGVLAPLDGIGPDDLKVRELLVRLEETKEVILATNPTVEGDATALYLGRLLRPLGVKVTRIARGISAGAELEFTDGVTLARALADRRDL